MIDKIKERLLKNIQCIHLEVVDESPNHGGYDGSVSHVKIIIVSDEFSDQSLINRHQLVYKAMGDLVGQIHEISIVSKTRNQWEESNEYPSSPECAK